MKHHSQPHRQPSGETDRDQDRRPRRQPTQPTRKARAQGKRICRNWEDSDE